MCIIIDTNVFGDVFNKESKSHPEFEPVINWILKGKGKIVYGGTKYKNELKCAGKYLKNIPLREHEIVLVIDEKTETEKKKSLLGLWKEYGKAPGSKEIDEMRKEVWENFPREDI